MVPTGSTELAPVHLAILFEDAHVLAVDKPKGLASIPERDLSVPSLLGRLGERYARRLYVVHRLDKDVSGVILFAKTPEAHRLLSHQFSGHRIWKQYVALVHGTPKDHGTIRQPIREFGSGRMGVDRLGKRAQTSFEVVERLPCFTLLHVTPKTGRRHQIRVHLYCIGHPVVGDTRYGPRDLQEGFPRLMLHATALQFMSPAGLEVAVNSPLPQSFTSVLDQLRATHEGTSDDAD